MGSLEYFASTRNYLDISHIFFGFVNIFFQQKVGIMVFSSKCVIIFEILLSLGKTFELMKIIKEFSHIVTMIQNVIINLNVFQLYYFERAAETYIRALQTGQPLRLLSHAVAQKTSDEIAEYPGSATNHLKEIKLILDEEGSTYAQ